MTQSGRSGPTSARRPVLFRLGVASSGSGFAGPTMPSRRQSDSSTSGEATSGTYSRDPYPAGHLPTISIIYEIEKALTNACKSRLCRRVLWQQHGNRHGSGSRRDYRYTSTRPMAKTRSRGFGRHRGQARQGLPTSPSTLFETRTFIGWRCPHCFKLC